MQKTTNFQLNQWEKTDRIMMEDFNADNETLEAALKSIWDTFPLVKLSHYTVSADTTYIDLDLSGVDLTGYASLRLYARFPSTSIPSSYLALQVNNLADGYVGSDGEADQKVLSHIYVNKPMATADAEIDVGHRLYCGYRTPVTTDQITSLNLTGIGDGMNLASPTLIPAGTKLTLYALKR